MNANKLKHKMVIRSKLKNTVLLSLVGVSLTLLHQSKACLATAFVSSHTQSVPMSKSKESSINSLIGKPSSSLSTLLSSSYPSSVDTTTSKKNKVDICIIGGGISGLSAAITSATNDPSLSICLLEATDRPGGRVTSDITNDGFVLDRGFAVFIENYPQSRSIFDYNDLQLQPFDPGALIRLSNPKHPFARIADPLRQPSKTITALLSPVGTWKDKLRLAPLFLNVKRKSIQELFQEEEMDTLSCLKQRYKFSDKMIAEFFNPFLEGIFLCPLQEQSSRMFHFVFKMNADGSSTLPTGGMQSVSNQLAQKAMDLGVDIRFNHSIRHVSSVEKGFLLHQDCTTTANTQDDKKEKDYGDDSYAAVVHAQKVICATDYVVANQLLSTLNKSNIDNEQIKPQPQRSVGCIYYGFQGDAPLMDPILILNGSGNNKGPINNVCFPSVINDSYAPKGYHLCSVAVTESTMEQYKGRMDELDNHIRNELAGWFADFSHDIKNVWERKGDIYEIKNAQPSQLNGSVPANVHGGRDCTEFHGMKLPDGIFVCGDHMSTATLNGAIESGINAANIATSIVSNLQQP